MSVIAMVAVSVFIGICVTSGVSYSIRFYRRRFELPEKKASIVIGVCTTVLPLSMFFAENAFPGRPGELIATALIFTIILVGFRIVWRTLA